jgi:hypothetical protein
MTYNYNYEKYLSIIKILYVIGHIIIFVCYMCITYNYKKIRYQQLYIIGHIIIFICYVPTIIIYGHIIIYCKNI